MPNKIVAPNGIYQIEGTFVEENDLPYEPAVDYSISGNTDTRTSISNTGILKLGGGEAGPTITVTGEWRNDDGSTDSATLALDVDPQGAPYWPNPTQAPEVNTLTVTLTSAVTQEPVTSEIQEADAILVTITTESTAELIAATVTASPANVIDVNATGNPLLWQIGAAPGTAPATVTLMVAAEGFETWTRELSVVATESD